jgi:hypothetical protein
MAIKITRGFTIFFATLIGSLSLALGIAVFELTLRELDLAQTATASLYAIYAADAGAECALYWDYKCTISDDPFCGFSGGSAFATSSPASAAGASANTGINCNSMDITGTAASYDNTVRSANAATTTFTLRFDQAGQQSKPYCAQVIVAKVGDPSQTTITSRGFNTCTTGAPLQLERSLKLVY